MTTPFSAVWRDISRCFTGHHHLVTHLALSPWQPPRVGIVQLMDASFDLSTAAAMLDSMCLTQSDAVLPAFSIHPGACDTGRVFCVPVMSPFSKKFGRKLPALKVPASFDL